ncbi:MAG: hypothetical protein A2Y00_04560 [Omnitrophica WOR_2 bacterium GWF2_43_52]|nr:MAG: hypothetical protein A2Y01_04110 [Omnitrophica WOR_2 bacterium GWC2_44_8]OGX22312.1 MAG: hypothetical protein A2Y00_04560 [Omnitrophica WOR_2 bacterium GWF2_43_52]
MKKIVIIVSLLLLSGCATTYRTNSLFENYFDGQKQKTIAMMPPDIKIHRLTAGGVTELVDEWSDAAKKSIISLIQEEVKPFRSLALSPFKTEFLNESEVGFLKEQLGLFNAVSYSIISHTYMPESIFKHKIAHFDYTLGNEIATLGEFSKADAFLFCSGRNYIWTSGRVVLSTFGLLLGAAAGVTIVVPAGPEWLAVSLVDAKTGDVVWFDFIAMPGDLRKEEVDRQHIKRIFSSFPEKWR